MKIKFTVGVWINETGILLEKVGDFWNVIPDKNKSIVLALKDGEFTIIE